MRRAMKLPALPDVLRLNVQTPTSQGVVLLPNTEANRAKSLGPVPFDMLHEATFSYRMEAKA